MAEAMIKKIPPTRALKKHIIAPVNAIRNDIMLRSGAICKIAWIKPSNAIPIDKNIIQYINEAIKPIKLDAKEIKPIFEFFINLLLFIF